MEKNPYLLLALLLPVAVLETVADQVPFAIVHGPKAAFNIAAPDGWVIDNSAGSANGLPCVLYRKGDTWENADPLMYTKIASTSVEDAEAFAKTAIEEMKKQRGEYETKRVEDGRVWFVNEFSPSKSYPRLERVAYVQLPKAVAYIVYSADSPAAFRKHESALKQLLESLTSLDVKPDQ